jgi:hypothetical protein
VNCVTLEVLLHHYSKPGRYPGHSPSVMEAYRALVAAGLVAKKGEKPTYIITKRGGDFVRGLLSTPLPTPPLRGRAELASLRAEFEGLGARLDRLEALL